MIEIPPHTWIDVVYQAITFVGPVIITGAVGIVGPLLATRQQNKHRSAELRSEIDFKAREHVFEIRRRRWEEQRKLSLESSRELVDYLANIPRFNDEQKLRKIETTVTLKQKGLRHMAYTPGEGAAAGPLIDKLTNKAERDNVEQVLSTELATLPPNELEDFLLRLIRAYGSLDIAREKELEDACIIAFGPFINFGVENEGLRIDR